MPRFFLVVWLAMAAFSYAQQAPPLPESQPDRVPNPDPTTRTVDQLRRENQALREIIETRLNGMDKAIELLQKATDKLPALIDAQVAALRVLHDEKFFSISTQFEERDVREKRLSEASTVAIGAALQAAKEAVTAQNISNEKAIAKSEGNTTKLLDNLDVKIIDLKEQLGALKNQGIGQTDQRSTARADGNILISVVGGIVGVIGCFIALGALIISKQKHDTVARR